MFNMFKTRPQYPSFPERIVNGVRCTNQYDTDRWQVKARRVLAAFAPSMGYGTCDCCGLAWWIVQGHSVPYARGRACFPVCESCFANLNSDELWPYYEAWLNKNYPGEPELLTTCYENLQGSKPFRSVAP